MASIVVENERQSIHRGESTADNLLSILVRSADQNKLPNGQKTLSDDEIYGNLFIYNVAGHDTASGTLAHCLVLLAANPVWQDWVSEEIDHVFHGKDPQEEDYALAFPKLKRCLALMVCEIFSLWPRNFHENVLTYCTSLRHFDPSGRFHISQR